MPNGILNGWQYKAEVVKSYKRINPTPDVKTAAPHFEGVGKGKRRFYWDLVKKYYGEFPVSTQEIGDCVGHGYTGAENVIECLEAKKFRRKIKGKHCAEAKYALSRVEIGKRRIRGDGSTGTWASRASIEYGSLYMKKYDKYDLRTYSGKRSREWGDTGLPDDLEPIAKQRLIKYATLVTSYNDLIDLMYCGFIPVICSNFGFTDVRDKNGFATMRGVWGHCWYLIGFEDDEFGSVFGQNSWGDWISGPSVYNMPIGSWRIHKKDIDLILRTDPDSYVLSPYEDGFPERALDYSFL